MTQLIATTFALAAMLAQVAVPPEQSPLTQNRAPVPVFSPPGATSVPSAQVDRWFATAAQDGSNAEIAMAKLALRRSHTDEVKSFARKMISEHLGIAAALAPQLRRISAVPSKTALAAGDALTYYRLEHVSDVEFDQTYILAQVAGHLGTLGAFQTESEHGADAQLKSVVATWTPTVQSHLQLAIDITRHIGGDSPLKTGAQ